MALFGDLAKNLGLIETPEAQTVNDYYSDIETPDIADMEVYLQNLVQQGVITPEDAQAALVDGSKMSGITLDPALKEDQMSSLSALQQIAESGGLTLADEANLNKIRNDELTTSRGAREAILQNAQSRGMGGSGLELASQLQNQQDAATRTSQRDMDIAGLAQQRALDAIMQSGELAGSMRGQEFNEKATVAGAEDAIAKFNAQNSQAVNLANTQAKNAAKATNLSEKQRVADTNVDQSNQQQMYNKSLQQQNYENQLKKAQGQSGIASENVGNKLAADQAGAQATNNLVGSLIGATGTYMAGGKKK